MLGGDGILIELFLMQGSLKKIFKLLLYGLLALVTLTLSLLVGSGRRYGSSNSATGIPFTFADDPGCGSGSGDGCTGSGGGGDGCTGSAGSEGSGEEAAPKAAKEVVEVVGANDPCPVVSKVRHVRSRLAGPPVSVQGRLGVI